MAISRHHATSRPLSVQEIITQAEDFEFSTKRPIQSWIRSAKMLLTQAAVCEQDGDLQMAYLYYYRHAELVLSKLPQHPEYKDVRYKHDLSKARRAVQSNLVKLEQLKPKIDRDYQRYLKAVETRNAERQRVEDQRKDAERILDEQNRSRSQSPDGYRVLYGDVSQAINAVENNQLAVDLARQELQRRDYTRRARRDGSHSVPTPRNVAHGIHSGMDNVHDGVKEAGRHLFHRHHRDSSRSPSRHAASTYQYPAVPSKEGKATWEGQIPQRPTKEAFDSPPNLPAKLAIDTRAPDVPPKAMASASPSPTTGTPSPPGRPALPAHRYTFKSTAFTEAGKPLRTVLLPPDLRTTFLNIAHPNTAQNKETCGILCGTLLSGAFFINHLVIPEQTSTSDTCDTTEEGDNALFDFCDSNELLVCGWIHTHPSQSCFLSSRDLHTSSGYQIMLPEAIAIVCSPRHNPDFGIFRLTDPPGLPHVLDCHQPGLFHQHSERNLYTDASKPGHVVEGPGLKFEVVDLRVK